MWKNVAVNIHADGYAVLSMMKEPVNSLNLDMWSDLLSALHHLEKQENINALVITSSLTRDVFSAGNDITELYAPNTTFEGYTRFWVVQNKFLTDLYKTRLATIAAIRGACPAGGCIISLCCDYRVMTEKGSIGLNEVALGISVPKYWGQLMAKTIGHATTERLLMAGRLVSAAQAKSIGLVDDLVAPEKLLPTACTIAKQLAVVPATARGIVKQDMRAAFAAEWFRYAKVEEPKVSWEFLQQPTTVAMMKKTLDHLSRKPKSKL